MNNKEKLQSTLQSDVISFLRFPLIIGIVLIHIHINTQQVEIHPYYSATRHFLSDIIARIAVPIFFLFSGFLFFYQTENFNKDIYTTKLKKRFKTLLVPYLFWNGTTIFIIMLTQIINKDSNLNVNITSILRDFWDTGDSYPISIQFWYIRDLMISCILSPVIYYLTIKTNYLLILFLGLLWVLNYQTNITGFSITSLFYFSLGAFFSIHKKNFVNILKPYTYIFGILYIATIFAILVLRGNVYLNHINILFGIGFVISLTSILIEKKIFRVNKLLTKSCFFIFAYHLFAIHFVRKFLLLFIPINKDIYLVLHYIITALLVVCIGLLIYYIASKRIPRIIGFITGGR